MTMTPDRHTAPPAPPAPPAAPLVRRSPAPLAHAVTRGAGQALTHPLAIGGSALLAFLTVDLLGSWVFFIPLLQVAGYVWRAWLPDAPSAARDGGGRVVAIQRDGAPSMDAPAPSLWIEGTVEDTTEAMGILRAQGVAPETWASLPAGCAEATLTHLLARYRAFSPAPLALAIDPETRHVIAWVAAQEGITLDPREPAVIIPDPDATPGQVWIIVLLAARRSHHEDQAQALLARLLAADPQEAGAGAPVAAGARSALVPAPAEEAGASAPVAAEETGASAPVPVEEAGASAPVAAEEAGASAPVAAEEAGASAPVPVEEAGALVSASAPLEDPLVDRLRNALAGLGILADIASVSNLPTRARVLLRLGAGVRAREVQAIGQDLELRLGLRPVRIEMPIGESLIAVDLPRAHAAPLLLTTLLQQMPAASCGVCAPVGITLDGHLVTPALEELPHLLVGGGTGSGKSTFLHTQIVGLVMRHGPGALHLALIDPKEGVEFGRYAALPHLFAPVAQTSEQAADVIALLVNEMLSRYREQRAMPRLVVVVDELAELLMRAPEDRRRIESQVTRLVQMGRAVGMHLLLATQRPSADLLTGALKGNVPARIAFRVADRASSMVVLDEPGAEVLIPRLEALYRSSAAPNAVVFQPAYAPPALRDGVIAHWLERAAPAPHQGAAISPQRQAPDWREAVRTAAQTIGYIPGSSASIERRREILRHPLIRAALRAALDAGASANDLTRFLFAARPGRITTEIVHAIRGGAGALDERIGHGQLAAPPE